MRKSILTHGFLLIATICLSQHYGFKLADDRDKVVIPVEIFNNMIVVPVVLNDQVPLKFILDTGVRTTVLTQKVYSDILGLNYSKEIFISGPGGKKLIDAYVTDNVSLNLPGVNGTGHSMLVLEQDYLELRNYLGTEVHGILGYELFSRFIVQMDYEKRQLTLMQPERFRKKRRYQTFHIKIEDTKPFINAKVRMDENTELDATLLMDTGASHGLILEPESDSRIQVPEKHLKSIIGRGLGGVITGSIGRINSIQMGKYKIDKLIANFPDPNSYADTILRKESLHRNGAIGGEVLSRFTVIFNFSKEEVYLKKNALFRKKFNYDMSGLTLKAKGAKLRTYEISDIRKGSQGEKAGLKVGDLVISVNGTMTNTIDLNYLNGFFNSKAGKRISLEVERGGERIKVNFRLANQI